MRRPKGQALRREKMRLEPVRLPASLHSATTLRPNLRKVNIKTKKNQTRQNKVIIGYLFFPITGTGGTRPNIGFVLFFNHEP